MSLTCILFNLGLFNKAINKYSNIVTLIMKVLRNTILIFWILVILVVTISEAGQHSAPRYQVEKTQMSNIAYLTKPFFREKRNVNLIPGETECVLQGQQSQDETQASEYRYKFENCEFVEECKKDWQMKFEQWKNEQEEIIRREIGQNEMQNSNLYDRQAYFELRAKDVVKKLVLMQEVRNSETIRNYKEFSNFSKDFELNFMYALQPPVPEPKIQRFANNHKKFCNEGLSQLKKLLTEREKFEKDDLLQNFLVSIAQTNDLQFHKFAANSASGCNANSVRSVLPRNVFILLLASAVSLIGAANVLNL